MTVSSKITGRQNRETSKPYLTGSPTDEKTLIYCLRFFGVLILIFVVSFIVCSSMSGASPLIRIPFNIAVIVIITIILFNNGMNLGSDAVAHGEILWQREKKGQKYTESERRICFHPLKGFVIAFIGSLPFIILALVFALNTQIMMTEAGTLPSWMQSYTRRDDISNALIYYTKPEGMSFISFLRIAIRICILPFVNLIGAENNQGLLMLERISPLILLLPGIAFGFGYISGKRIRTKIHTVISENNRKRKRKEKNAIRKRMQSQTRKQEPEQLN